MRPSACGLNCSMRAKKSIALRIVYTDGLNEAENPQQEQFGDDRLLEVLRRTNFENAQQVIESLKQEVEAYRNGAEPNDDFTMMCVKVC